MLTFDPSPASLPERLKQATHDLHRSLETGLGLLTPPIDRRRTLILIERFYGFHAAWEPAVAAQLADEDFLAPRRRAPLAAADLAALGRSADAIAALPCCDEAGRLADAGEAWGSIYVMEGSTLGGKLITRRLAEEDWLPAEGIRYFDPHGERTGALWRETRARLAELSGTGREDAVIDGARATFRRLAAWLQPALRG
jgi:heme oxygenase